VAIDRRAQRIEVNRAGDTRRPAGRSLHERERSGHAVVREQGGFDAGFCNPALSGALHHRDRAALQLRQCILVTSGDRHRMCRAQRIITRKPCRRGRA